MQNPLRIGVDAIARMSSTRTNYWAEVVIDTVLAILLLIAGWQRDSSGVWLSLLAFAVGLFLFSFLEYFFHRWMFHTRIPLFEEGHRLHHEHPLGYDSLPFFLPAVVLLILTGLATLIMPTSLALLMTSAMTFGYIIYGLCHFAIHHVRFKQPVLRRWAGAHHIHHCHPETNFGVTTLFWDALFHTKYIRNSRHI